jgi:hypothetical protein
VRHEDVPCLEDVLAHHELGALAVALLERGHELQVGVERRRRLGRRVPDVRLVDERQRDDLAHHAAEPLAPRSVEDHLVEEVVLGDERLEVVASEQQREPVAAGAKLVELLRGDAARSPPRRMPLEQRPELVHLLELGGVVGAHRRAAVRRRLEQALGLEHEQCLADRRAADAELLGELLLLETLPRGDATVDDRLPDEVGGGRAGGPSERGLTLEDRAHRRRPYSMQEAS